MNSETSNGLHVVDRPVTSLVNFSNNARTHSKRQIRQIADSIREFGFTNPVLLGDGDTIIAGHGRVQAAKLLGMTTVPTILLAYPSHFGTLRKVERSSPQSVVTSGCGPRVPLLVSDSSFARGDSTPRLAPLPTPSNSSA